MNVKEELIEKSAAEVTPPSGRKPLHEPKYRVKARPHTPLVRRESPVKIPPFKRRPWQPPKIVRKPRPVVNYPPIKLRKNPWKPPLKDLPHDPKLEKRSVSPPRTEMKFTRLKCTKVGKCWNKFKILTSKLMILGGSFAQSSKRFTISSNNKQCSAIGIVAIAYAIKKSIKNWYSSDVDNILKIGDNLYKKSLKKYQSPHLAKLKPNEILNQFFIGLMKMTTDIEEEISIEPKYPKSSVEKNKEEFIKKLVQSLGKMRRCIFSYNDNCYAIWLEQDNVIDFFNPHNNDDKGHPVRLNQGTACVLRIRDFDNLAIFLGKILKPQHGPGYIYSVEVIKMMEMPIFPEENENEKDFHKNIKVREQKPNSMNEKSHQESIMPVSASKDVIIESDQEKLPSELEKPIGDDYESFYKMLSDRMGILRGDKYVTSGYKVPATNIAALVVLRNVRSLIWNNDTITDIITLGHHIYCDNPNEEVDTEEVHLYDIKSSIKFGQYKYDVEMEHIVLGELITSSSTIANLEAGLKKFFKIYDSGILQGPQNIAIWQEGGLYYTFDAKERDGNGRKWLPKLANQLGDTDEKTGAACVMWFKEISDLVTNYMTNVPLKHRRDHFKITKIDLFDAKLKSDDWYKWVSFDRNKWILRGQHSAKGLIFSEENRNNQGTCMAAVAIAFIQLVNLESWSKSTVTSIMTIGDQFYTDIIARLRNEKKFRNHQLMVKEIDRFLIINDKKVEFLFDECLINGLIDPSQGSLDASKGDILSLEKGLKLFFNNNEYGILTACGTSIAIWKNLDIFYMFDCHPRDEEGKNPLTCYSKEKKTNLGKGCALRFTKLQDMAKLIANNFEVNQPPQFNISRVDCIFQSLEEPQNFLNYTPLEDEEDPESAILRATVGFYEGHKIFDVRANKQTLCNLMVAIGMSEVNPSIKWTKQDLNDILKMGDKIFCTIANEIQSSEDFELEWKDLKNEIKIGNNIFTFSYENKIGQFIVSMGRRLAGGGDVEIKRENQEEQKSLLSRILSQTSFKQISLKENNHSSRLSAFMEPPDVDLKTILNDLAAMMDFKVILDSTVLKLAMWRQGDLYFIFDPKESDEEGNMTDERMRILEENFEQKLNQKSVKVAKKSDRNDEIEPIPDQEIIVPKLTTVEVDLPDEDDDDEEDDVDDEDTESAAYVAVFKNFDDFKSHILDKIPSFAKEELFKLRLLTLTPKVPSPIDDDLSLRWYNFQNLSPSHWIMRASLSQSDKMFPESPNRNNQDAPNCLIALFVASLCKPSAWNSTILDVILKYGDRLFTKSVQELKRNGWKITESTRISPMDVVSHFIIMKYKIQMTAQLAGVGDITTMGEEESVLSIENALKSEEENLCILSAKNYSVAIWKNGNIFYMFDPHDIGPDGRRRVNGVACLLRFISLSDLIALFIGNLKCLAGLNTFQLFKVEIHRSRANPEENDEDEFCKGFSQYSNVDEFLGAFSILPNGGRIIHGSMAENCSKLEWHFNPPTACNVLASLVECQLNNVLFWNPKIIDKILEKGNWIYQESLNQINCKFDPDKDRIQPMQIIRDFEIEQNIVHIKMMNFSSGFVDALQSTGVERLKDAIEKLFLAHNYGILTTQRLSMALWRECKNFYAFCSQPFDKEGELCPEGNGKACLMSFYALPKMIEIIMKNFDETSKLDTYQIVSCEISHFCLQDDATKEKLFGNADKKSLKIHVTVPAMSALDDKNQPRMTKSKIYEKESNENVRKRKRKSKINLLPNGNGILMGKYVRSDPTYSAANVIIAVALARIKRLDSWSSEIIDTVVKSGMALYRDSMTSETESKLKIDKIWKRIFIAEVFVEVAVIDQQISILNDDQFEEDLWDILQQYKNCYIRMSGIYYAIMEMENQFYIFNSRSFNSEGLPDPKGTACLLKFTSLSNMVSYLRSLENNLKSVNIEIGGIDFVSN